MIKKIEMVNFYWYFEEFFFYYKILFRNKIKNPKSFFSILLESIKEIKKGKITLIFRGVDKFWSKPTQNSRWPPQTQEI